jgi:hypothetical protein
MEQSYIEVNNIFNDKQTKYIIFNNNKYSNEIRQINENLFNNYE